MKFTLDGEQTTREEVFEKIGKQLGIRFLDNLIENAKDQGLELVTLQIGDKATLRIDF